jgi:hypothetical protein
LLNDGIEEIIALITISDHAFENLIYEDPNKNINPVKNGDKVLIQRFCNYVIYCSNKGNTIGNNLTGITSTSFDQFCTDHNFIAIINASSTIIPKSSSTSTTSSSSCYTVVILLLWYIKHDPSQFFERKNNTMFNGINHLSSNVEHKILIMSLIIYCTCHCTSTM